MNSIEKHYMSLCTGYLIALVGSKEQMDKWWNSRNLAFEGMTPAEKFKQDYMAVYRYLAKSYDTPW